jgi:hypothetical protein
MTKMNGGYPLNYPMKYMEQNKMNDAINNTLRQDQIWNLAYDINNDLQIQLIEEHPEVNKHEIKAFICQVINTKVKAILSTLTNDAYENIVKVVTDKLNLNDLFDNRQEYLN